LGGFPFPSSDSLFSDAAISHYPNGLFLSRAIMEYGSIPLWSPAIMSGTPFAANPLSGLWYPPGWLALLFPLPLGFTVLVMGHLFLGSTGVYRLLKFQGLSNEASILGAIAYGAMPKLFAHYGAGHITLIYAVSWTPWLLVAESNTRSVEKPKFSVPPGVVIAIIFLADVRWSVYSGMLWIGWLVAHSHNKLINQFLHMGKQIIMAGLLSTPLLFSFGELISLSTRANLSMDDFFEFSLPPPRVLGILFPDLNGQHEWMVYSGGLVFVLAVMAIFWKRTRKKAVFWVWIAGISLLYSMGNNIPGLAGMAKLPGFSLLRVPSRALFITGLAIICLGAIAADQLKDVLTKNEIKTSKLVIASLIGFCLILSIAIWILIGKLSANFIWGNLVIISGSILVILRINNQIPRNKILISMLILCCIDLGVVDQSLFIHREKEQVLSEKEAVAKFIKRQPGSHRVYSPSYSLPQHTASYYGIELVNGVDPMQLATYVDFIQDASGVPQSGYSITVPPLNGADGDVSRANTSYIPDASLLGFLNTRFVVSEFDLEVEDLVLVERFNSTRIYENLKSFPRAWIENQDTSEIGSVRFSHYSPNIIIIEATGPGLLVLSEMNYPGWQVRVDGKREEIQPYKGGLLRSVSLGEGDHAIEFRFYSMSVIAGVGISLLTQLILILRCMKKVSLSWTSRNN
jgi:hypothetical protein